MTLKHFVLCTSIVALSGLILTPRSAEAGATVLTTERVASGIARPVFATHVPGDDDRLFIVEQRGRIRILDLNTNTVFPASYLDIDSLIPNVTGNDERGLLGLAFHPDYANNGHFFVYYTNNSSDTVVARYTVAGDPATSNTANAGSAVQVLFIDQPFSNHNGGWIGFSPNDGHLYIATGDGGSACDPGQRAQDITNQLLGKMLRINVDSLPYTIPGDNPFVGVTGDDEIWAYGLRNPYRCSFDRVTGDLYILDVGQNAREEVDFQSAASGGGENYGWDCREGTACANTVSFQCNGTTNGCSCGGVVSVDPIHEFTHGGGNCSGTGGYLYRGSDIPGLQGTYFFADFCSNQIWSFEFDGATVSNFQTRTSELAPPGFSITSISSFGEDNAGELYICDLFGGEVFKIIPVNPPDPTGACCLSFGCLVLTEVVCGINNGEYEGDSTLCLPDPCPPPCDLIGDMNVDGTIDGDDISGYLRAKFHQLPIGGENTDCADYGTGTIGGDNALFVGDLLS